MIENAPGVAAFMGKQVTQRFPLFRYNSVVVLFGKINIEQSHGKGAEQFPVSGSSHALYLGDSFQNTSGEFDAFDVGIIDMPNVQASFGGKGQLELALLYQTEEIQLH